MDTARKEQVFNAMHTFINVGRVHRAAMDKVTAKYEIHRSQHRMLLFLLQADTEPSQKELCEHFGISAATVAVTLKKLEKRGCVERTRLGDDNRVNCIRVTEKGRWVLERTKELFDRCDELVFEGFTSEELETLISLLNKMQTNIETAERKEFGE